MRERLAEKSSKLWGGLDAQRPIQTPRERKPALVIGTSDREEVYCYSHIRARRNTRKSRQFDPQSTHATNDGQQPADSNRPGPAAGSSGYIQRRGRRVVVSRATSPGGPADQPDREAHMLNQEVPLYSPTSQPNSRPQIPIRFHVPTQSEIRGPQRQELGSESMEVDSTDERCTGNDVDESQNVESFDRHRQISPECGTTSSSRPCATPDSSKNDRYAGGLESRCCSQEHDLRDDEKTHQPGPNPQPKHEAHAATVSTHSSHEEDLPTASQDPQEESAYCQRRAPCTRSFNDSVIRNKPYTPIGPGAKYVVVGNHFNQSTFTAPIIRNNLSRRRSSNQSASPTPQEPRFGQQQEAGSLQHATQEGQSVIDYVYRLSQD